ncbi:LOW QUALITY PROTEIN: cold-responsive protein kinase 1-like [Dioscorea cayenensis subsp. rotundata]|uniref:LOW QUALITY PROTEIN: cold-responsive protein kinase 1-like n=1 Tax=Dioscorea cayennensis subsp. rotundata TaxID=55577 RepID=A0AB40AJY1_DIOCR|nr:LOW QUALITY PROTEIN: cold-responsive protein kinase 1-like [Dioscorea cayenensis subsp. rotundata]
MTCFCHIFKRGKKRRNQFVQGDEVADISGIENTRIYTYNELSIATEDFSPRNKIGEGGFGSVYMGKLADGNKVAIKVLSSESRQGVKEFLTELTVISSIVHDNLVKLYGCCVEANNRILVYGYLENNSLAQTLLGKNASNIQFSWKTRAKISIGVARGLAFLHEEAEPHIVHRDIKASNILLDKDLTPKISDFGLAKLVPANVTHVSTRVAGTMGYLAPEYAVRGQVTWKSDVYSFGVLLLEIVSGRCNTNTRLPFAERFLLDRVWSLYEVCELREIVDMSITDDMEIEEACKFLKVGLLCTQDVSNLRPTMSTVVHMLTGEKDVDIQKITKPGLISDLMNFRNPKKTDETNTSSSSEMATFPAMSSETTTYISFTFTAISERD